MILVDFNHLAIRNLYSSISQAKLKKVNGFYKTEEWSPFFRHFIFNSLKFLQKKFVQHKIIICVDSKKNWRKEIYPGYKSHRKKIRDKSAINFNDYFEIFEEIIEELKKDFPYKVIQVPYAEADDIIAVLAKKLEKTIIISSDKDFKQLLRFAKIYDPIKNKFIKASLKEIKEFMIEHILLGDVADNIPNIKQGSEFSDNFKRFLRNNDIFIDDVKTFENLSISKKLYDEFDIYKKNKKGEKLEKDIFKTVRFGPKGAKKFAEDLKNNLKQNPIYLKNFERNKKLIIFDFIPQKIQDEILNQFNTEKFNKVNIEGIIKYFSKNNLSQLILDASDFLI